MRSHRGIDFSMNFKTSKKGSNYFGSLIFCHFVVFVFWYLGILGIWYFGIPISRAYTPRKCYISLAIGLKDGNFEAPNFWMFLA